METINQSKQSHIKTKHGVLTRIYIDQKGSSKKRNHNPPAFTKEQLKEWLFSQDLFHKLFNEWVDSGYEILLKPSVDRKEDDIGYTMDNIQLMTWGENKRKAEQNKKNGVVKYDCKPVVQYDKNLNKINEYHSISEADRQTGIDFRNISAVLNGKRKTTGGFIWKFKNE